MNVLITSASSKLRLIDAFQRAVHDIGGTVLAVDSNENCAAATFADNFVKVPRDDNESYEQDLLEICDRHNITLIIPTRDGELVKLASMKSALKKLNVSIPLPDPAKLSLVLDKVNFYTFCRANGFPVYDRIAPEPDAPWPLFARECVSSGSQSATVLSDYDTWRQLGLNSKDIICQQVSNDKEYSIDVFLDYDSNPIHGVARYRSSVCNGECDVGIIEDKPALLNQATALCVKLGLRGHNVVQAFCNENDDIHFIEVNARYGGGSMMSVAAGLHSPAWLLQISGSKNNIILQDVNEFSSSKLSYGAKFSKAEGDPISYRQEMI